MSKVRLVVKAVVVEGRTHAEVAAQYGLSRSWVTRLVARYRLEGDTAFEARSRRPRTSPTVIPAEVVELVVNLRAELSAQGLDAGPHTVCWHLQQRHQITVSPPRYGAALLIWVSWSPTPRNARSRPTSGSPPICPTRCGSQTSPTGASPQVPTPRSSPG